MRGKNKTKPPIVANDAFIAKQQATVVSHKRPGLVKLAAADREYLLGMWEIFKMNVEPTIIKGPAPTVTKTYRYTPRQMWENVKRYFEFSIEHGQPLTLSGIAAFNDVSAIDLFHHDTELPEAYDFLKTSRQFIMFYNEYAAHKKMNPAGPIFLLKNLGLKDTFTIDAKSTAGALTEAERTEMQKRLTGFSEINGGTLPTKTP